jgi:hypothetical protein
VAVRELPGTSTARDLYAVARASSVRRPAVAVIIRALTTAARGLPGGIRTAPNAAAPVAAAPGAVDRHGDDVPAAG